MSNFNKVVLVGNLVTEPELKEIGDSNLVRFRMAINRRYTTKSGEKKEEAILPEIVTMYEWFGFTYLKFVVATQEDADEAEEAVNAYRKKGFRGPVYLMPLGGVESVYSLNNRCVAELAMKKGWRYSDRLQVPLFKNEWGT